jgi:signal transduction histidine kinase
VAGAAVNVITEDAQHQIAAVGVAPSVCTRHDSMCAVVLDEPVVWVRDARLESRFAANPFVDGRLDAIRFYASAPLVTHAGVTIGRLCAFDPAPQDLCPEGEESLVVLARRIMDMLELRRRARELERSNQRLADFATQVGHDLASPLAAIRLHVELAQADLAEASMDTAPELLEEVATVTRRMTDQIHGILRAARADVPTEQDRVDLGAVVEAVRRDLAAAIVASGATVTTGRLPTVRGDRVQLHSLLLNLVSNSLKYVRPGHAPVVHIACRSDGDAWLLEVHDQGRGVPPADRERVFGRFDRGPGADDVSGHGIGLATARQVVEAHGGTIRLDGHEGPGSVVEVRLPV